MDDQFFHDEYNATVSLVLTLALAMVAGRVVMGYFLVVPILRKIFG